MYIELGTEVSTGCKAMVSENAVNRHVLITGISGSGKTYRLFRMEECMVQQGARILVLDIGSTHRNLAIPE